jgi:tRNA nucleotidyltransferase (CCA-adding enzyme)
MSDYNFLMESRLSPEQFRMINYLSRIAASRGLNFYLVGGAVRDLTYGQQVVRDLDFAVEGDPQKILRLLQSPLRGSDPQPARIAHLQSQPRLSSSEITFANGVRVEISMARSEYYSKPGRRPEIEAAGIFEDLRRRDFSVNAMAVSLHPNSRGLLLDPTNGAADIERRELRALHSRSFQEDPSRIYRLLRLGTRLDFKPEERTRMWLDMALESRAWERMDPEQQGQELRAILQEDNPARVLKWLSERKLLAGLDRKLGTARLPYDHFSRIRSVVQSIPGADAFLLNFHCLTARLGGAQRKRLASKVIRDRKTVRMVLDLEGAARKLARILRSSKAALPSQTYTLLHDQPLPLLAFLLVYFRQTKIQARVKSFLFKYPIVRARMPHAELLTLGLEAGPKFEKIFHQLFLAQLDGKIKTHQQLLKEFRVLAGIKEPAPKPAVPARPARAGVKVKAEKKTKRKK